MLELWPATAMKICPKDVLAMADLIIGLFWTGKCWTIQMGLVSLPKLLPTEIFINLA